MQVDLELLRSIFWRSTVDTFQWSGFCSTAMYFCIFIAVINMHIVYDVYMYMYIVLCLYMNL